MEGLRNNRNEIVTQESTSMSSQIHSLNRSTLSPIYISRPLLPNLYDYYEMLENIWDSRQLTNNGPYCRKLESSLKEYLDVPVAKLLNNGTTALMVALKLFDLPQGSEVITTPFTFAATAHSISWIGLKPVFVDILPEDLTIDPDAVEVAINKNTSAILAVHVYGSVCQVDRLQQIAKRYELRLIYDSAHAFGTTIDSRPIASYGDATIFSFHATKLFNTIEGGLVATNNSEHDEPLSLLLNFGILNEDEVSSIGINGKMNELQAALGLLNLPLVDKEKSSRVELRGTYLEFLETLPGIHVKRRQPGVSESEQYFPIVIDPNIYGRTRDDLYEELKCFSIYARKYFHPTCTDYAHYTDCPIISVREHAYTNIIKNQVLCLPFHSGVTDKHVSVIRNIFIK